ncbi:Rab1a [Spironucleus salmonicida]|uniref:Rab GTPase n=1 Tax=Spironucleus salmonicida TaxID=348837 RepID=V6LYP9_9EUKA|nr:Rab1a [Spironucleus salmonicida]|eukprot:EST49393.1 Rab GTPase [Spironucleus salmonicida]
MSQRKLFKFVVIGDCSVGKSAILKVYRGEEFTNDHTATIGVDFYTHQSKYDNLTVTLQLWDTAGEEKYQSVSTTYFRGAHAVFIVYDVSSKQSFDNVQKWIKQAKSAADSANLILIGNKADLEKQVPTEEAQSYADSNQMLFLEVSAKNNEGIKAAFEKMIAILCEGSQVQDAKKGDFQIQSASPIQKVEVKADSEVDSAATKKQGCC